MPAWGLGPKELNELRDRGLAPWGLDLELLEPGKVVTDPVHGDIHLTKLEVDILDSPPLQRLRRVRQLGTAHLVYPGAVHTRFEHVMGTLRAAQDLFDAAMQRQARENLGDDLFSEWVGDDYYLQMAEALVLARLGALLHDLTHIPYGHTLEDELQLLERHDSGEGRFNRLWAELPNNTLDVMGEELAQELRGLVLASPADGPDPQKSSRYPFVYDIVGNTICADLVDYLRRDAHYTGLPLAIGSRFLSDFRVLPSDHPVFPKRMAVRITRRGRIRRDAVTEMLKYLRYRYELSERVLYHHAKLAADAMLAKMLGTWAKALALSEPDEATDSPPPYDYPETVKNVVEQALLQHGDDGLLEMLRDLSTHPSADVEALLIRVRGLALDLLGRRLYKRLAVSADRSTAEETVDRFKRVPDRLAIEAKAAAYAGIDAHEVAVWVPPADMRLKAADVLVDREGVVSRLSQIDDVTAGATEIYESHRRLWAIAVYGPAEVAKDPVLPAVIGRWFQDMLGIPMVSATGEPLPTLERVACEDVARQHSLTFEETRTLEKDAGSKLAALGGAGEAYATLRADLEKLATSKRNT